MAAPPRRLRRFLLFLGGVLVVLLVLVALGPTLISTLGLARGVVTDALGAQINADVDVSAVRVGWRGPQTARGVRIVDRDGAVVADVNVEIAGGLLGLLGDGPLDVRVTGETHGVLREDGSLSWQDLAVDPGERPGLTTKTPEPPGPLREVRVAAGQLGLDLRDVRTGRAYEFQLEGDAHIVGGGTSRAKLTGRTADGGLVVIEGEAIGMLDDAGEFSPSGASLDATITVTNLPVPGTDIPADVRSFILNAETDDLSDRLVVTFDADTTVADAAGDEPVDSHLEGRLAIDRPLGPLGPRSFAGTIEGKGVPTALLRPLLSATPVDPTRDVGRVADIAISLPGGDGGFAVQVVGEALDVSITGTLDAATDAIAIGPSHVRGLLHPDLLRDLAGVERELPVRLALNVREAMLPVFETDGGVTSIEGGSITFTIPPHILQPWLLPESGGARVARPLTLTLDLASLRVPTEPADTGAAAFEAKLTGGPLVLADADGLESELRNIEITLASAALSDRVDFTIDGVSRVPGQRSGRFDVDGAVAHLLDPERDVAVDLVAGFNGISTAIVDALADFDGRLVASLGPFLAGQATATAFGPGGGRLDATLQSDLGVVRVTAVGAERTLVLAGADGAAAELRLTPLLRRQVLAPLFPLFADFVSSDPVRIDVRDARIPLDGDLTRLDAKIHVEFGAVTFAPESPTMGELGKVLALFDPGSTSTRVGRIQPLNMAVVGGLVEIPGLTLELSGHPITFAGTVDLRTQALDLKIADLAKLTGTRELSYLEGLVELSIRGTADKPIVEPVVRDAKPEEVIVDVLEKILRGRK